MEAVDARRRSASRCAAASRFAPRPSPRRLLRAGRGEPGGRAAAAAAPRRARARRRRGAGRQELRAAGHRAARRVRRWPTPRSIVSASCAPTCAGCGAGCRSSRPTRAPAVGTRFDRVVLDLPCTGTGTLRRHPELKWRISEGEIGRLASRRRALLEASAPLVAPGGLLVAITCSLEGEENEDVMARFLSTASRLPSGASRRSAGRRCGRVTCSGRACGAS